MDHPAGHHPPITPSPSKLAARGRLEELGAKLSDGTDYLLPLVTRSTPTLAQARQALKPVIEPLSTVVLDERQQP